MELRHIDDVHCTVPTVVVISLPIMSETIMETERDK